MPKQRRQQRKTSRPPKQRPTKVMVEEPQCLLDLVAAARNEGKEEFQAAVKTMSLKACGAVAAWVMGGSRDFPDEAILQAAPRTRVELVAKLRYYETYGEHIEDLEY